MNGIQEVSGSIPLISTKIKDSCSRKEHESLIIPIEDEGGYLIQTWKPRFEKKNVVQRYSPKEPRSRDYLDYAGAYFEKEAKTKRALEIYC